MAHECIYCGVYGCNADAVTELPRNEHLHRLPSTYGYRPTMSRPGMTQLANAENACVASYSSVQADSIEHMSVRERHDHCIHGDRSGKHLTADVKERWKALVDEYSS